MYDDITNSNPVFASIKRLIMSSIQAEDNEDVQLVSFFTENAGIDSLYKYFTHFTYSEFLSLTEQQVRECVVPDQEVDEEFIVKLLNIKARCVTHVEIILLQERNEDIHQSEGDGDHNLDLDVTAARAVTMKITPIVSVKSCIMRGLTEKCDNCVFNNLHTSSPKLCHRLRNASTKSAPQLKPFPFANFELVVMDRSMESQLIVNGIRDTDVKKTIGAVIYEYMRTIFP